MPRHRPSVRSCVLGSAGIALTLACGEVASTGPLPPAAPPPPPTAPPPPPPPPPPTGPVATSILVAPSEIGFSAVGDTATFVAAAWDAMGRHIEDAPLTWVSTEPAAATVDAGGLVTATGNGAAGIVVSTGAVSDTAVVDVAQVPATIRLSVAGESRATHAMTVSTSVRVEAEAVDALGTPLPEAAFTWSLSDAGVADVDSGGRVLAKAAGITDVTAAVGEVSRSMAIVALPGDAGAQHLALVALFVATGGRNWTNNDNWLTGAPLGAWHGVTVQGGRITALDLSENNLRGPLPPEIGDLRELRALDLFQNRLTGPIPGEIGRLSRLSDLRLMWNQLTGPIPAEIGDLRELTILRLALNELTGAVPPGIGNLTRLQELYIQSNPLFGPLPESMTALLALEEIRIWGTELCIPQSGEISQWAASVRYFRDWVECEPAVPGPPRAYLTQAIQSLESPVPLSAGREALLRVFPTSALETDERIPPVRATFHQSGAEVHRVEIPAGSGTIPMGADPGVWDRSANIMLPDWLIQPGLEMVVEIDPGGVTDPDLGVRARIPETGRMPVDVRAPPSFGLTIVPIVWNEAPDYATAELAERMSAGDEYLWATEAWLPVGAFDVQLHPRVRTSAPADCDEARARCAPNPFWVMDEMEAMRVAEGSGRHYMGVLKADASVALLPGKASVVFPEATTIAHELGHNLSLLHAPCAVQGDPEYPHEGGIIGSWGFRAEHGRNGLVHPTTADFMSYCSPEWISGYNYGKALAHRVEADASAERGFRRVAPRPARSLLLWGRVTTEGRLVLEPSFVIDAPPQLPGRGGPYQIVGRDAAGAVLFAYDFGMRRVVADQAETRRAMYAGSFAFAVPAGAGWANSLATVTLSGPEGIAEIGREGNTAMALLMERSTGRVRGFLRDLPMPVAADGAGVARGLPEPGLDAQVSAGVPPPAAWERGAPRPGGG